MVVVARASTREAAVHRLARAEVEAGLDGGEEVVAIRFRDAEEDADHLHGQLSGDVGEEVDRLAVRVRRFWLVPPSIKSLWFPEPSRMVSSPGANVGSVSAVS